MFQSGFETTDYGTSMNLFANGQAAMFYMGSWEMSMATNEDVAEDVRSNIGVFMMPVVDASASKVTDIAAWNGGGYAVTENSAVKEEAVKLFELHVPAGELVKDCMGEWCVYVSAELL